MPGEDNNSADVFRTFAGMAGELEDLADKLTARQSELAKELAAVDDELQRVEGVRAAMFGKNPRRPSSAAREPRKQAKTNARVEKITEWARGHGREFTGKEVADVLGIAYQGVGPILAGMARRGEATVRDDTASGTRVYALAGEPGADG